LRLTTNQDQLKLLEALKRFESVLSAINAGAKQAENVHRVVQVAGSFHEVLFFRSKNLLRAYRLLETGYYRPNSTVGIRKSI
jgi:hypothetical protein